MCYIRATSSSLNKVADIFNLSKNNIFDIYDITLITIRQDKNSQFWKNVKEYLIANIVIIYNLLYFYREAWYITFNIGVFSYRTLTAMSRRSLEIFHYSHKRQKM